ncbi:hypothetical protein QE152_g37928 [Popillia japonica]|uniref:Reverse transcriptase Ty1/copia-type domain-containing protein n=1 Tax=Popillia japonica TaxID=7064 RepID=A0AAW1I8L1_POPJA
MKDMGTASNCLGLHITQHENGDISLDQSSYINDILKRFKMSECTPKSTPSDTNVKLSLSMCPQNDEDRKEVLKIPYQEAVGALLYLSQGTRPDITFAVNDVNDLTIGLKHISTDHMVADLLTKALPKTKHFFCTKEMGLIDSLKIKYLYLNLPYT